MKREIDINEISDGKLYSLNDMVKADCNDCVGCSDCCHGMGESILLDPMDIFRISCGTGKAFGELLQREVELNVVDGIVLPNLKLAGDAEACCFLDQKGRCSIHAFRPGICRLFPLGRIYQEGTVKYFLQIHECTRSNRSKVKVKKWLDIPESKKYEQYILDWHNFLNALEEQILRKQEEEYEKKVNLYLLKWFYMYPFSEKQDFYEQFYERLKEAKHELLG